MRANSKFFEYRKNLGGVPSVPTPIKVALANSTTLKRGQAVRINTAGFAVAVGVGNPVGGIVDGLVDNNNIPVNAFQYQGNTGHTNGSTDDTVTSASDNQTRTVQVFAEIIMPLEGVLFYNDASADLAQTNLFQLFDVGSTSDQIDFTTASDSSGQFQLIQLDPDNDQDLSKGLFRVAEPQLLRQINNSAAVVSA